MPARHSTCLAFTPRRRVLELIQPPQPATGGPRRPRSRPCRQRHGAAGQADWPKSEFGRKVAVDFETDTDFDQSWSRPSHCRFLLRAVRGKCPREAISRVSHKVQLELLTVTIRLAYGSCGAVRRHRQCARSQSFSASRNQREAPRPVMPIARNQPDSRAVAAHQRRKPSCLISWTQPGPDGGRSARNGRQGSMNANTRTMRWS